MNRASPLLIAVVDALTHEQVRAVLRQDALSVILGVLFVALGLAAVAMNRLRARSRDPAALWFGLFAVFFGVRLLALAEVVRFVVGGPEEVWFYVAAAISYTIPLPALLFLREVFPSWRRVIGWVLRFQLVFAGTALVRDQILARPDSLRVLNSVLMLVAFLALIVALFRQSGAGASVQALRVGALTFCFTVVLTNLSNLNLLPSRIDLEPLGFAVFLGALGRVVVARVLEREERLVWLDKELDVARSIQQSILPPRSPTLPQLDIAVRYVPMASVAGDFYEFLCLDERRLGIVVADVSGHGVPAALIASMVKVAISAQIQHADNPAAVLAGMNQTLCGNLQGQFVTAAYLFVDLGSAQVRYGAAGHPALVWCRRLERSIETIVENGLVLGLMPQAEYTFTQRTLARGDRFLMYTDGLVEATNGNEEPFGGERLEQALRSSAALTADQAAAALLEDVGRWVGHADGRPFEDDLTLLVIDV